MLNLSEAQAFIQSVSVARLAGDVDALMALFHENATFRIIGLGAEVKGREAIRATVGALVDQFPFLEWEALEVVVHGATIAARQRLKVRHGQSGKIVETETAEFLTVKDGRCLAYIQFADTALVAALSRAA